MQRPLVIVGPPGSLKTELGRIISERSGYCVVNADASTLAEQYSSPEPRVIVLTGQAWLDREVRVNTLDRCVVISIVPSGGLDGTWGESSGAQVERDLWRAVDVVFDEAHWAGAVDLETLASRAEEVLEIWRRDPIAVAAGDRSYLVDIGHGIAEFRLSQLLVGSAVNLVITDSNVDRLYGTRFTDALLASGTRLVKVVFDAGEEQKHLQTLAKIFEAAQAGGIDRSSSVIAIGGGVVTDVAGFAAATWMRGVRWLGVSTTLLGMVDASVGGKTAVDFGQGKNAVGAFWQPSGVVCDTEWLATETARNYTSALAEVVKTALIGDPVLFEMLEARGPAILARDPEVMAEVVRRCIRVKARIVGLDATERGVRATLNLGHTVGHAIEAQHGYGQWSHGEAVSLGLVAALRVGERLGFTSNALSKRVRSVQEKLGLPVALGSAGLPQAVDLLGHDKKRAGSKIRFVFVEDIGSVSYRWLLVEDLRGIVEKLGDR